MNEELESTNEELGTINDELRKRSVEVDALNAFMDTILSTLHVGVAVLDREQVVRVWNDQAAELWGLRADEVEGVGFFTLDIGLPLDGLRAQVGAALAGERQADVTVEATNRRGRAIRCRIGAVPVPSDGTGASVVVVMEQLEHPPAVAS